MTYEALVIDDDPAILEAVADILDSLGHKYDQARSQEDARRLLAAKRYSYYLLDLELPVRTDRGLPRIQTGENLLGEIVKLRGPEKAPIIVMTGHGLDCPDLAVQVMKNGAVDYVKKPFPPTGNTLDRAILEALAPPKQKHKGAPTGAPDRGSRTPTPFTGGEMVFFPARVTLCGRTVVEGRTRMRRILEVLREKRGNGKFVAYSGAKLAAKLGATGGQNAIAETVKAFRNTVTEQLESAGFVCGREDVLLSRGTGYRLAESIMVRAGNEE
jgi:FixJ family two-component response regulator